MYISDRLVYFEMPKTGGTKIRRLLQRFDDGELTDKHGPAGAKSQYKDRLLLSSIRNPWDWYVSLWAFGCSGNGQVAHRLTNKKSKYRKFWLDLYSDPYDRDNFNQWLLALLDSDNTTSDNFPAKSKLLKSNIGYMTYRFLKYALQKTDFDHAIANIDYQADLQQFLTDQNILDEVIRTETLAIDLQIILERIGKNLPLDQLKPTKFVNPSAHNNYQYYYTADSAQLIAKRDAIIIDRFDYRFEG